MSHQKQEQLIELMAACADKMQAGESVSACLAQHPEHAAALEPLLNTLAGLNTLRPVPARAPAVAAQRRAEFIAAARAPRAQTAETPLALLAGWLAGLRDLFAPTPDIFRTPRSMPAGLAAMLVITILSGLLLTGMVTASANTLPGQALYPVKITAERVQMILTFDQTLRQEFQAELAERRIAEAQAVAQLGLKAANVRIEGVIEALSPTTWQVSGLALTITPDSRITGEPVIGARVHGMAHAPGDGSLILRYVEIEPLAGPAAPAPIPTPSPTATRVSPTATVSPTSTAPAPEPAAGLIAAPGIIDEPAEPPVRTPTATPTPGPTATRTPTATYTPTVTRTPTITSTLAPAREHDKRRIGGFVQQIAGSYWTINGVTIEVNGATVFIGLPRVGSLVEALVEIMPSGAMIALSITEVAPPPEATPTNEEFMDIIHAINGSNWTVGSRMVIVTGETVLENDPGVGDWAEVDARRYANGELRARRISAVPEREVNFVGVIEALSGGSWQIDGRTVWITGETQIFGEPAVGAIAEVAALELPDGRVIAKMINVKAPEPTPTPTIAVAEATPTPTLSPTTTPEATMTPTPSPAPTASPTNVAPATATPTATPRSVKPEPPTATPTGWAES